MAPCKVCQEDEARASNEELEEYLLHELALRCVCRFCLTPCRDCLEPEEPTLCDCQTRFTDDGQLDVTPCNHFLSDDDEESN